MEHSTNPAENEVQKPNTKQTPTGRPATRADVKSLSEQRQKEGYGGEHGTQQLCEPETPHGCQFWRSHVVQRNCQCLCSARMQGGPPAWHRGLKSWHGSSCDLGVDYSSADPWPRNSMCQTEKRRKEKKKASVSVPAVAPGALTPSVQPRCQRPFPRSRHHTRRGTHPRRPSSSLAGGPASHLPGPSTGSDVGTLRGVTSRLSRTTGTRGPDGSRVQELGQQGATVPAAREQPERPRGDRQTSCPPRPHRGSRKGAHAASAGGRVPGARP